LGVFALAALCQIDDRRGLSARIRFAAQLLAVTVICAVYPLPVTWWVWPLLVVAMVWMTNLYNFMDGADGLAGGMALIGFGTYAVAAIPLALPLAGASASVAGAALGFLFFNRSPARLFLGDAGSIPLGFLAGTLGLIGWSAHAWAFWFPLMVFLPFIADASVTLARRLLRGERFWEAHREHFYQRMIQMDTGHGRTIRAWYALMLAGAMLALCMVNLDAKGQSGIVAALGGAWIVVLLILGWSVERRWASSNRPDDQL
jgi:UDP-N-acetylmuramyl pentapeptide phosphotransferase/UDP-N-acetylglucosamine-1-phosphate transferase